VRGRAPDYSVKGRESNKSQLSVLGAKGDQPEKAMLEVAQNILVELFEQAGNGKGLNEPERR
jgi:hypothetical protein